MFASLRSRLWLTYALLIGFSLLLVGGLIFLAIARSPIAYQPALVRLRSLEAALVTRLDRGQSVQRAQTQLRALWRDNPLADTRVLLLDSNGNALLDLGSDTPTFRAAVPLVPNDATPTRLSIIRDVKLRQWGYTLRQLDNGAYLMLAARLPVVRLRAALRDELYGPLIRAGLLALLLSVLLAYLMGRWIAAPLRRIARASEGLAAGRASAITPEGPSEVQALARSFNDMVQQVEASQQSQRDFVANVSHELKTPLTSIQGFAQAILDGAAATPETLQQAAGVIASEAARMARLVNDLLALARLEAGTANLAREPVDLSDVLAGVLLKLEPAAQAAGVSLAGQVSPGLVVRGDGDRLAQVFSNLLDNAIKYTPRGGSVRVEASSSGGQVLVKVIDTGAGITPADLPRIFDRFYQADKSRRGARAGVGLGLPIARQIVTALGGTISVDSKPGQGSVFVVKLPLKDIPVKG